MANYDDGDVDFAVLSCSEDVSVAVAKDAFFSLVVVFVLS